MIKLKTYLSKEEIKELASIHEVLGHLNLCFRDFWYSNILINTSETDVDRNTVLYLARVMGELENIKHVLTEDSYIDIPTYKEQIITAIEATNDGYKNVELTQFVQRELNMINEIIKKW